MDGFVKFAEHSLNEGDMATATEGLQKEHTIIEIIKACSLETNTLTPPILEIVLLIIRHCKVPLPLSRISASLVLDLLLFL